MVLLLCSLIVLLPQLFLRLQTLMLPTSDRDRIQPFQKLLWASQQLLVVGELCVFIRRRVPEATVCCHCLRHGVDSSHPERYRMAGTKNRVYLKDATKDSRSYRQSAWDRACDARAPEKPLPR